MNNIDQIRDSYVFAIYQFRVGGRPYWWNVK